jgi:hypothetical protein
MSYPTPAVGLNELLGASADAVRLELPRNELQQRAGELYDGMIWELLATEP